jgi:hypothetical protein
LMTQQSSKGMNHGQYLNWNENKVVHKLTKQWAKLFPIPQCHTCRMCENNKRKRNSDRP